MRMTFLAVLFSALFFSVGHIPCSSWVCGESRSLSHGLPTAGRVPKGQELKIWRDFLPVASTRHPEKGHSKMTSGEREFIEPITGMEFVRVPGGCYQMGNPREDGNEDEEPAHEVCVKGFYLGKFEATQDQWERIMGDNPSFFKRGGRYPVENISWHDIQEFIRRLNRQTGLTFRLPTEAEWEYAARSGGRMEKWAGTHQESDLDDYAWTDQNSGEETHPVGEKKPNSLGLFDMSGNVWEWIADWYDPDYYKTSPRIDPQGPNRSWDHSRVIRGGSWISRPEHVRSSLRARAIASVKGNLGFRLVVFPQNFTQDRQ